MTNDYPIDELAALRRRRRAEERQAELEATLSDMELHDPEAYAAAARLIEAFHRREASRIAEARLAAEELIARREVGA